MVCVCVCLYLAPTTVFYMCVLKGVKLKLCHYAPLEIPFPVKLVLAN